MQNEVKIHFPLSALEEGPKLLDPTDTETIWEYYLLENLSCGLVRDSSQEAIGYVGCISDRFYQPKPNMWLFHIPKRLWSDGTEISDEEIEKWIIDLRSKNTRHLKVLKQAKRFEFIRGERNLVIEFDKEVDQTVLHELSLADAGLFPIDFEKKGWTRTAGPYSVEKWDKKSNLLILRANPHSVLFSAAAPPKASLFFVDDLEDRKVVFSKYNADVASQTPSANPELLKSFRETSSFEYVGHPTHIGFFYFNPNISAAHSVENRREFAQIIYQFQTRTKSLFKEHYSWEPETQLIPQGFHGRLPNFTPVTAPKVNFGLKNIKVALPESYKFYPLFAKELIAEFSMNGVTVEIVYEKVSTPDSGFFAKYFLFVGNQMDASGSWSFLTSKTGALTGWTKKLEPHLTNALSPASESDRNSALINLHTRTLQEYFAVPVIIGSPRYFFSNRVRPEGWNKFDSRLRIYELRMQ